METEKNGKTAAFKENAAVSKPSINDLVRELESAERHPLLNEYVYMGIVPFFRYYLENIGKYLGANAASRYEADIRRLNVDITEKEPSKDRFLIDLFVRIIREKQTDRFEELLYTVLIMPMEVVRAKKLRETEKTDEDIYTVKEESL